LVSEEKLSKNIEKSSSIKEEIEKANKLAVERMMDAEPIWVGMDLAKNVIPGLKDRMLIHAGPPIEWERVSGPLKGALIGASIYEGWASTPEEAEKLLRTGEIVFEPTHHHDTVGPMAGVVSPNMPIFIVYDRKFGNYAYSNMNEGIGKVLRYGAYSDEVLNRLKWMSEVLYPVLKAVIEEIKRDGKDGLEFKPLISQALHMGDDCHNRYVATTTMFLKEIAPYLVRTDLDKKMILEAYDFMARNPFTTLNLGMASAKIMCMAAHGIKYSTIATVMTRNGTDTGIWVSGLGQEWFVAPAPVPKGVWFPGYSEKDANPDIGDSSITETAGFGGFAMAAAPAIVSWVGGTVEFAVENTKRMYQITYAKHKYFTIPYLGFQGTPTGVDIRKVVATGITPTINTGIAHKDPGVGQIGAGIVTFPVEHFKKALKRFAEKYGI
jgi:hypothetical protein